MSNSNDPVGSISWTDLTVPNADEVRRFYELVVGWTSSPVEMGGYTDFCMNGPKSGQTVAGICHARGVNANMPPQWMIYITVEELDASIERCVSLGGQVIDGPRAMGGGRSAVIQDPAGAVAALYEPSS